MSDRLFWGTAGTVGVLALAFGLTAESDTAVIPPQEASTGSLIQEFTTPDPEIEEEAAPVTNSRVDLLKEEEETPSCHPSYSGCLNPNASDYDCASGSGNGPYYTGPVQVFGYDEYDLDRDNDGWGCESS